MASFEKPAEIPQSEGQDNSEEKDKAFSPEGVLNRNFGKDVEKPSEAQFYRDGILNRPQYQENLRKQRDEKLEALRKDILGEASEPREQHSPEATEKPFSPEGLLNRNFGKKNEQVSSSGETVSTPKSTPEIPVAESASLENVENKEKPLMQQMVEAYQKLGSDPEKAAYEALYNRLEPNLSEEEKQKQMARMSQEYRLFKEGKDWKQSK